ncbi:Laminin subunit alpha-2 [Papilio xuthus]|uniref:Laminin subunit alpha-2 n=1 Tax=Papilio xuthus TaxID=66420 RepID=A0A194PFG5_PAPXU|nr:Laminin subunit alpha-2 [Papilio xuthus]
MDIDDITKFANSKRIVTDADKLREKVTKEKEKIIKLKVAQDTAYWDLKEKLQQVQDNHERLQQNMADVQMQHEAANSKYQEELRQRPEILNKLSTTRKICDVLQESSERLRETLSRCKADGAMLYTAFNRSADQLREMRNKQMQEDEKVKHQIEGLQEKVSLSSNHFSKLVEYLASAKQQVDSELAEARTQLTAAHTRNNDLLTSLSDSNRELDKHKHEIDRKDDMITHLQREMKRKADEYNIQNCNANKSLAQKDKEIQEAIDAVQSLKQVVMNQEQFIKNVSDERNALQEKVVDLEEEQHRLKAGMETLKIQMQDLRLAKANVEESLDKAVNENNDLKKENFDYVQELTNIKKEVQDLQMQINLLEKDKAQIDDELQQSRNDSYEKFAQIQQLVNDKKQLEDHIEEIKNDAKSYEEIAECKQKELEIQLQNKDKEIDTKVNAINCLMSEVKMAADVKFKLEDTLAKFKKEMELERDAMKDKEEKSKKEIKKLQESVRVKEAELSQNMTMILELRNEKDRLHQSIQDMQQTLDNVEKELTGRRWPAPKEHYVPELDDNAKVTRQETVGKKLELMPPSAPTAPPAPEAAMSPNSLLNMFTDSSSDDERLNETAVKRCFAALSRGETLTRTQLATLKKRPNRIDPRSQTQKKQIPQEILSNAKEDIKTRPRKFFKHKRLETKK